MDIRKKYFLQHWFEGDELPICHFFIANEKEIKIIKTMLIYYLKIRFNENEISKVEIEEIQKRDYPQFKYCETINDFQIRFLNCIKGKAGL